MIIPLMSCSARLPVYLLLITFITPREKPWIGGLTLSGLYVLGIMSGTVVATILSRMKSFKHRRGGFQLELPAIRRPIARVILRTTFSRSMNYLRKAGPIIILIGIGLWLMTHLPVQSSESDESGEYVAVSQSYAATAGRVIEPVMKPMGLDYRAGVAMMMGFAAREVFVSAMTLMYRIDVDEEQDDATIRAQLVSHMREVTFEGTDQKIFTLSSCFGLLFFFAFALQCFPTVVVSKNELGGWKYPLMQLFGYTGIAYVGAVLIVQGMRVIGLP
jgi:ferrous iron transport protein B